MASPKQIRYLLDELIFSNSNEAKPSPAISIENSFIRIHDNGALYEEADFDFAETKLTTAEIENLEKLTLDILDEEQTNSGSSLASETTDKTPLLKSIYYFSNERYLDACSFDRHGRPILHSIDKRIVNLLQVPIADILIQILLERLHVNTTQKQVQVNFTCDFDILDIFATLGFIGSIKRFIKAILKLRFDQLKTEVQNVLKGRNDYLKNPFLNDKMFYYGGNGKKGTVRNIGFLLVDHQHPTFDTRNSLTPAVSCFIRALQEKSVHFGLHPSYLTMDRPDTLSEQLLAFQQYTGETTSLARFHFLRCLYPREIKLLERYGFSADYSFGFADSLAFRGGMTGSFRMWDINSDCVNTILIHPLTLMESTFFDYLKLPLEEAKLQAEKKLSLCLRHGRAITLLWHNRSMYRYGFEDNYYPELFDHIIQLLQKEEIIA